MYISLEDLVKKYNALEKVGVTDIVDKSTAMYLKELVEARAKIERMKLELTNSLHVKDALDHSAVLNSFKESDISDTLVNELARNFYIFPKSVVPFEEFDESEKYYNAVEYYCNSLGEMETEEVELPKNLRTAYNELWTDGTGSECYLVEYNNEDGIVFCNEFDKVTAEDRAVSMETLYSMVLEKAKKLCELPLLQEAKAKVFVLNSLGFCECHEINVFIPWNTPRKIADEIAAYLDSNIYEL